MEKLLTACFVASLVVILCDWRLGLVALVFSSLAGCSLWLLSFADTVIIELFPAFCERLFNRG